MSRTRKPVGSVSIVGAGPGDPGLLTLRGVEVLAAAEVVIVDPSVESIAAPHWSPEAEILRVGPDGVSLDEVGKVIVSRAKDGGRTVRVVDGDPFVSSYAIAEAQAAAKAKARLEIVPGVPSVVGVTDYAGVPVGLPRTVATVAGHPDWPALA